MTALRRLAAYWSLVLAGLWEVVHPNRHPWP